MFLWPHPTSITMSEAMVTGQQDALLFANPQTLRVVYHQHFCARRVRAAERDVYILLDEAFIDYLPEHSLVPDIDRFPNLIVFRSSPSSMAFRASASLTQSPVRRLSLVAP